MAMRATYIPQLGLMVYLVVFPKKDFYSKGMEELSSQYNYNLKMTGPSSMPYPWFEGDENLYLIQKYCKLAANHGLFFIHHNWFISDAHDRDQSINLFL